MDASAYLKRYLDEADSDACVGFMAADTKWITSAITLIEVRRNLTANLSGPGLDEARADFARDWDRTFEVGVERGVINRAVVIAEQTGSRSLDAIHLATADRLRYEDPTVLTYDRRQMTAAHTVGLATASPEP